MMNITTMKQPKKSKKALYISFKSKLILSLYTGCSLIILAICFFPFISEINYRNAYFLTEQAKIQNFKYINRFTYSFEEFEEAIRFFPLETHYASEYIKNLDIYASQLSSPKEQLNYFSRAMDLMKYIQKIDPINPWYHIRMSALCIKLFMINNNEALLEKSFYHARQAVLSDYENPIFLQNFANILQRNGRISEAYYYYKKALDIDDSLSEIHYNLGSIYFKLNKFNYALNSFLSAKRLAPKTKNINGVIIQTYDLLQEYKKAEQFINTYKLFLSKESKTLDIVSLFYFKQNKLSLCLSYLDLYLDLPEFSDNAPAKEIYERYILALSKLNKPTQPFIQSQLQKYPNNNYLQSLQ